MLNFLLDITPDKSQLLITIKLAGILREKKQEVYYTYTSNPAFTPVLYNKGISNCVLYPDDFRWLKPDLTLLDCRHAAHASLYRKRLLNYILCIRFFIEVHSIVSASRFFHMPTYLRVVIECQSRFFPFFPAFSRNCPDYFLHTSGSSSFRSLSDLGAR